MLCEFTSKKTIIATLFIAIGYCRQALSGGCDREVLYSGRTLIEMSKQTSRTLQPEIDYQSLPAILVIPTGTGQNSSVSVQPHTGNQPHSIMQEFEPNAHLAGAASSDNNGSPPNPENPVHSQSRKIKCVLCNNGPCKKAFEDDQQAIDEPSAGQPYPCLKDSLFISCGNDRNALLRTIHMNLGTHILPAIRELAHHINRQIDTWEQILAPTRLLTLPALHTGSRNTERQAEPDFNPLCHLAQMLEDQGGRPWLDIILPAIAEITGRTVVFIDIHASSFSYTLHPPPGLETESTLAVNDTDDLQNMLEGNWPAFLLITFTHSTQEYGTIIHINPTETEREPQNYDCQICNSPPKSIRLTQCFHTICFDCFLGMRKSHTGDTGWDFACPICRTSDSPYPSALSEAIHWRDARYAQAILQELTNQEGQISNQTPEQLNLITEALLLLHQHNLSIPSHVITRPLLLHAITNSDFHELFPLIESFMGQEGSVFSTIDGQPSILTQAIRSERITLVQQIVNHLILQAGDINSIPLTNDTLISLAIREGQDNLMEWLLDQGASPAIPDDDNLTSLIREFLSSRESIIRELVNRTSRERSAIDNTDIIEDQLAIHLRTFMVMGGDVLNATNGQIPILSQAISSGRAALVQQILEHLKKEGWSINDIRINNLSLLEIALKEAQNQIAIWLLDQGISPTALGGNGLTPIQNALSLGRESIARELMNRIAGRSSDINHFDITNHINWLIAEEYSGNESMIANYVRTFIKLGGDYHPILRQAIRSSRPTLELQIVYSIPQDLRPAEPCRRDLRQLAAALSLGDQSSAKTLIAEMSEVGILHNDFIISKIHWYITEKHSQSTNQGDTFIRTFMALGGNVLEYIGQYPPILLEAIRHKNPKLIKLIILELVQRQKMNIDDIRLNGLGLRDIADRNKELKGVLRDLEASIRSAPSNN